MKPVVATSERAGLVSRLSAFVIDLFILTSTMALVTWTLEVAAKVFGRFAPPVDLATLAVATAPFLVLPYFIVCWRLWGQTPGKRLMGVKIVALGGGPLTTRRVLLRLLGYALSALPCYLGFLWIIGPRRQGWHDRLARTEVVYTRPAPAPESEGTRLLRRFRHLGGRA